MESSATHFVSCPLSGVAKSIADACLDNLARLRVLRHLVSYQTPVEALNQVATVGSASVAQFFTDDIKYEKPQPQRASHCCLGGCSSEPRW
eukprot:3047289-Amphidinium_carterae.1